MTPVEAVARALCVASYDDPDEQIIRYDGVRQDFVARWKTRIPEARAALAALREPTPGMIEAMRLTHPMSNQEAAAGFAAAIDAAMEE